MTMVVPVGPRGQAPGRGRRNANRQTAVRIGLGRPRSGAHTGAVTDGSGARPGGATDEIVGGGGPRRRSGAVLFLVAAVLAGYAVSHRGHPPSRPQASPPVPAPVLVRQAMRARPGPELSGSVTVGPAGLRVLVDGIEPRIVDAHSLDVTPVPGLRLPKGQAARVLQLGPAGLAALASLNGPNGGIYLVRPGQPPLLLGGGGMVLPSRAGALLMATHRPGATTVAALALDRRVRWQWELPGNVDLLRDTPVGLVVAQYADAVAGDAELLLVDRQTGAVRRRLGHGRYPLAADDRSVAWVPTRCDPDCAVLRAELATGVTHRYRMPAGREPVTGAFAPDGRRLAVSFSGQPANVRAPARPGFAGILELRAASLTRVPGLSTPPNHHADVVWSADGRWLVLGVTWPEEELIAVWRPGSEVVILPVALPGEPTTATLATLH